MISFIINTCSFTEIFFYMFDGNLNETDSASLHVDFVIWTENMDVERLYRWPPQHTVVLTGRVEQWTCGSLGPGGSRPQQLLDPQIFSFPCRDNRPAAARRSWFTVCSSAVKQEVRAARCRVAGSVCSRKEEETKCVCLTSGFWSEGLTLWFR